MKEFWLYYDYLRRWWLILLLGPGIGALAGLGYVLQLGTSTEFKATAVFTSPIQRAYKPDLPGAKPTLRLGYYFTVTSPFYSTERAAAEWLVALANQLETETNRRFEIQINQMERSATSSRWKLIVLGSAIGALFAIGGIYVWEDAGSYRRHRQSGPPDP